MSLQVGYAHCRVLTAAETRAGGGTSTRLFDLENSRRLPYDLREGIALDEGALYAL